MSTLILYHVGPSPYAQRARLALIEKGVDWEGRVVDIGPRMENYEPWYMRLNPAGEVPTLQHGDRVVTGSTAICRYIDETFDGPALTPLDPARRAELDALVASADAVRYRALGMGSSPRVQRLLARAALSGRRAGLERLRDAHPELAAAYQARLAVLDQRESELRDPVVRREVEADLRPRLHALEAALGDGRPYLTGETYTLADVLWTCALARIALSGRRAWFGAARTPRLDAWYGAMQSRPSFREADIWDQIYVGRLLAARTPDWAPQVAIAVVALGIAWLVWEGIAH